MRHIIIGFTFLLIITACANQSIQQTVNNKNLSSNSFFINAQKKVLKDVVSDEITKDTQVTLDGSGDKHVAMAWWIPLEFWMSILERDKNIKESERKAMFDALSEVSLLAVVQADITRLGAFKFYSKEKIENNMKISFSDFNDNEHSLFPMQIINPDLQVVLGVFKPILSSAMGNLGKNMHFYVFNDKSGISERLLDPYIKGQLNIQLTRKDNVLMNGSIEMPINALFIPRKCPNGKDAHISWKYCPWTGKPL